MVVAPPHIVIFQCPNGHDVAVPAQPGFAISGGVGVVTRCAADLIQDCPTCGPFRRHPDGQVELHVTPGAPISIRPIAWCVDELRDGLRRQVHSEDARTAMAEDGRLANALERLRSTWEPRGVDFDAVIEAVVDAERLHPVS